MFECVQICTVSDTLQHCTAVLICPACPVWYRMQTGAPCLAWSALPPVMCNPSGCAGSGRG
nr:MAG TPA: Protein of unknown function (DUF2769) [Caudoviricetes sp.]